MKDETLLDVAGVLTIISSCVALLVSLLSLITYYSYRPPRYVREQIFFWIVVINCFGFPLGLTGGILALLRKRFILTTSGMVILVFSHVLSIVLPFINRPPEDLLIINLVLWCLFIIILSLGPIITIKKREAFS